MDVFDTIPADRARPGARRIVTARRLTWLLAALAAFQVAAGLALAALNRLTFERFFAEYVIASGLAALAFAAVGALIASRRPRNVVGWLLCAAGLLSGLGAWTGQYARYTFVTRPGALPQGDLVAWLYMSVAFGPFVALVALFLPLLFPNGQLASPGWRPVAWLAVAATVVFTFMLAINPGPIDASLAEVSNPFAPAWATPVLPILNPLAIALMLASLAGAVAATIARFRRARGPEREQLKWFVLATALLVLALVTPAIVDPAGFTDPVNGSTLLSGVLLALAFPLLPVAVGIAILRHRLYDVDVIISRALVYGALTLCVVGLYIVVVGYLGTLFHARGNLLISLVATGLVAVLFQPLRERLQRAVNRLVFGERDDPYAVLSRLGQQLEAALAPDAVLPTIAQTVRDALRLPYVAIALHDDDTRHTTGDVSASATGYRRLSIVAALGTPPGTLALPLVYQGETVGELRLAARPGENEFGAADRRLLDDMARHMGAAVHATRLHARALRLAEDLQQSRERLVGAREEERRRLRRDLHDGLGPALAGLTLKVDAAHDELYVDVDAAAAMLRDLKGNLREAIADIRRLVYALRPPALDELGLLGAIRALVENDFGFWVAEFGLPGASGFAPASSSEAEQHDRMSIRLDLPAQLPPLPAAVEVAAYRIVAEALTNVVKHAAARHCYVRLALAGDLEFEVADDGRGLGAGRSGVGTASMRERAEELGGVCAIEAMPGGGTRVSGRLPL
jgi:signal transduction histidine kinase